MAQKKKRAPHEEPKYATTRTTTFDDGEFLRTALIVAAGSVGSVDVLDGSGKRLAQA